MADPNNPTAIEKSVDLRTFTPGVPGFNTGNPTVDTLMGTLLSLIGGTNLSPRSVGGRSVYDGYLQRERSRDFMKIAQNGFGDMPVMNMFGPMDKNSSAYTVISRMMGQPDSPLVKMLAPFNGGNPVAAQMGAFSGLSGMTMDMFGNRGNLSVGESGKMMRNMYDSLYEHRTMGQEDLSKVRTRYGNKINDMMTSLPSVGGLLSQSGGGGSDMETYANYSDAIGKRLKNLDKAIVEEAQKGNKETVEALKKEQREFQKAQREVQTARSAIGDMQSLVDSGTALPTGTKFDMTRGFDVEELMRGYVSGGQLKMIDGKKGVLGSHKDFINNGVDVMDSARSLFGVTNGAEIMEQLNQFIGAGSVDLGNEESANKLSDMLRRVKGAAKTAGVSVDAILGIIKEGQMLASSHPQLQYLGGQAIADISIKALTTTSAMAATLGGDFMRKRGGEAGVAQSIQQSSLQEIQEPVSQTAMAANFQLEQMKRTASPEMRKRIEAEQKRLQEAASDPTYGTKNNFADLLIGMGNRLGINGIGFLSQSRNELIQKEAASMEGNSGLGQQFARNSLMTQMELSLPEGVMDKISNYMEENRVSFGQAIANPDFAAFAPAVSQIYQYNPMAIEQGMLGRTKGFRRAQDIRNARVNFYAGAEKEAATKMSHLQTPLFTNIAQAFMKGELSRDGLNSIKGMIADGPDQTAVAGILTGVKDLSDDKNEANAGRLLGSLNPGESGTLNNVDNVKNFHKIAGLMGLEDLASYTDEDGFAAAKATNEKLKDVAFEDIQRAQAFGKAAGMYDEKGKSRYGNKKHSQADLYNIYGEKGLTDAIATARKHALAPLEKAISADFLKGNQKALNEAGGLKPGTEGYNAFWGGQAELDKNYVQWDGNKRVGFDVAKYQKDMAAGTVSSEAQEQVNGYMGQYDTIAKGFDDAQSKIKQDMNSDAGGAMSKMSDILSIFSRDLPSIVSALTSLNSTLATVAK